MSQTYYIHIKGLVQGVGFRPFVCKLATSMNIGGWVSNTNEGVVIEFTASLLDTAVFYYELTNNPPPNALIVFKDIFKSERKQFKSFTIRPSVSTARPDLLLTPDIAMCIACKEELTTLSNKRNGYAFTTCLNCGPRYSIVDELPYDRENTTMDYLAVCDDCNSEYHDINNRRHYSQTNSCKSCAVNMHLYHSPSAQYHCSQEAIPDLATEALLNGQTIAVKGVGGYLLLCDATNLTAIENLRTNKHRPTKPFAVLYDRVESVLADVQLRQCEKEAIESKAAPIVLCTKKSITGNNICTDAIAPGLNKLGVMIAYTPLLYLLASNAGRPLIATSANISGSPIIYKDDEALAVLFDVAALVLTFDRDILIPQDDSVLQFTNNEQKIILRRSRGLAPNYFPNPLQPAGQTILATGGELKSAFALQDHKNLYISQFLGDQGTIESQESYLNTLNHLLSLLQLVPTRVLVDAHPGYSVSDFGREISRKNNFDAVIEIQHHKAHFAAVLAENQLLNTAEPVLGVIWDGTGYGEDHQIWGSELFIYHPKKMERIAHLNYFPQLAGDKMSKEPRLSALSLLKNFPEEQAMLTDHFSAVEWKYFQKLLQQEHPLLTSSMGRFLDGLACILGIKATHSYEGEAAMLLEAQAGAAIRRYEEFYPLPMEKGILNWHDFIKAVLKDRIHQLPVPEIAWKIFNSLANGVVQVCHELNIARMACSGGVFQNAVLTDLITGKISGKINVYFHRQLSSNDECIGFGQLAYYEAFPDEKKSDVLLNQQTINHQLF